MRKTKFKGVLMPDVRPLHQRENKMDVRKGMLQVATEKKPVQAVVEMSLFGNPYQEMKKAVDQVVIENKDLAPDSMEPDYEVKMGDRTFILLPSCDGNPLDPDNMEPDYIRKYKNVMK